MFRPPKMSEQSILRKFIFKKKTKHIGLCLKENNGLCPVQVHDFKKKFNFHNKIAREK